MDLHGAASGSETGAMGPEIEVDVPLQDPGDDALGRLHFAKAIARLLAAHTSPDGFVIALSAAWGSGKSSLLNFIDYYLNDPGTTAEDRRPIVIRFNPWWYSGPENLLRQFLGAFEMGLRQDNQLIDTVKDIGKYVDALSPLVSLIPIVGTALEKGLTVARTLTEEPQSPDRLRQGIDAKLRAASRQILVIIDDIDRLPAAEIREVFKLVKSVANFPRTLYLLAFDKTVVATALGELQGGHGLEYLRKIVQLEIDVPEPDPVILRHLLHVGLDRVLGRTFAEVREAEDWEDAYQEGFRYFLRTLRDVKRYLNAVGITYPLVRRETHPFDFLAIELIRIAAPDAHDAIKRNKERFVGGDSQYDQVLGGGTPEERKPFYDALIEGSPTELRPALLMLLRRLFPKVDASYSDVPRSSNSNLNDEWRRERRVCSADVFPVYFQLGLPIGDVSAESFEAVCKLASDRQRFASALSALVEPSQPGEIAGSRLVSFLQRLGDRPGRIAIPSLPDGLGGAVGALYDIGDPVFAAAWERLEDSSVDDVIVWTIARLLGEGAQLDDYAERLAQLGRFERMREALTSTRSIYVPLVHVRRLARAVESFARRSAGGQEPPTAPASSGSAARELTASVATTRLEELKRLICEKIDHATQTMEVAEVPRLAFVLNGWTAWCAGAEARRQEFVRRLLETEGGLARLIGSYLQISWAGERPRCTVELRELSKDVGDRDAMNAQYERAALMRDEEQSHFTPRMRLAISAFKDAWLGESKKGVT